MTQSFSELRKSRTSNFDKLNQELAKQTNPTKGKDERFWQPTVDKAGNGYAVIRFLPAPQNEDIPFVRRWDHGFEGPGGWYIELSRNTIGEDDPVSDMNSKLWKQGEGSEGRKIVSGHGGKSGSKRRMHYISNIYVVEDPANPDNNGKVFLYQYGKKIFDKLNDAMNPRFPDEKPMNPFDLWEGANFKVKIRKVEGYRNYDQSEFSDPAPLLSDDAAMEEVWKSEASLQAFVSPTLFKSYDDLQKKLNKVLGLETKREAVQASEREETQAPAFKEAASLTIPASNADEVVAGDDDDSAEGLEFFAKLAQKK